MLRLLEGRQLEKNEELVSLGAAGIILRAGPDTDWDYVGFVCCLVASSCALGG
jgi:hypothetical protein